MLLAWRRYSCLAHHRVTTRLNKHGSHHIGGGHAREINALRNYRHRVMAMSGRNEMKNNRDNKIAGCCLRRGGARRPPPGELSPAAVKLAAIACRSLSIGKQRADNSA